MKILFVDDVLDTRQLYDMAFRLAGHSVRLAASGEEAVVAVREQEFDLLITDIQMPLMDGWQTVKAIRQLPNGRSLPVVVFTAYPSKDEQQRCEEVGARLILHKPVLPSDIIKQVDELLVEDKQGAHN